MAESGVLRMLLQDRWRGVCFLAGVLCLTLGFHHRYFPGSQIITTYGFFPALVAVALLAYGSIEGVTLATRLLKADATPVAARYATTRSFLLATLCALLANLGPNAIGLYSNGRFVRLVIWLAVFGGFQLAYLTGVDHSIRNRLRGILRGEEFVVWRDAMLVAFAAVFVAEVACYFDWPYVHITPFALALNVALLGSVILMVWAIAGRGMFAATLTLFAYSALMFANVMKMRFLYTSLQPGDQTYFSELLHFTDYFEPKLIVIWGGLIIAFVGIMTWMWRNSSHSLSRRDRCKLLCYGLAIFLATASIPWLPNSHSMLMHFGVMELRGLSEISVKRNGLLMELAMQLPESYVPKPSGYSQPEIARIIAEHTSPAANDIRTQVNADSALPSVIVFFFEALMNPLDFNRPLTRDPIPNFNALLTGRPHGYAISPRFANGSAESEFELLTGMSTGFLPLNSCAYKHFLKRTTPSLVSILKDAGNYHSTAVKCVGPGFYNFQEAYQHLQFDRFCFDQKFDTPTFDQFSGHIADESFADEMLRPLSKTPALVIGENLGSHAPYYPYMMGDKPRFLVEPSNPGNDRIETYLQAISRTDDALGNMLAKLQQRPDRVLVLIVGDHHPPFAADSHAYDTPAFREMGPAAELHRRRTPYVVWKNYESSPESSSQSAAAASGEQAGYISLNFLPLLLFQELGILPTGLHAWNQKLFEVCPVVSRDLYYTEGQARGWDQLSPELQQLVSDYQTLQYDLLHGKNYAEKLWPPAVPVDFKTAAFETP